MVGDLRSHAELIMSQSGHAIRTDKCTLWGYSGHRSYGSTQSAAFYFEPARRKAAVSVRLYGLMDRHAGKVFPQILASPSVCDL